MDKIRNKKPPKKIDNPTNPYTLILVFLGLVGSYYYITQDGRKAEYDEYGRAIYPIKPTTIEWIFLAILVFFLIILVNIMPLLNSINNYLKPKPRPSGAQEWGKVVAQGAARAVGGRAAGALIDAALGG